MYWNVRHPVWGRESLAHTYMWDGSPEYLQATGSLTGIHEQPWLVLTSYLWCGASLTWCFLTVLWKQAGRSPWSIRLVPSQDGHFFYTRSHLSALQNCALLLSTKFQFIFIFKKCITQFSHWIVSCTVFFQKYCTVIYQTHAQFCSYWIIDFLQKWKKLFYCSRELSVFRT